MNAILALVILMGTVFLISCEKPEGPDPGIHKSVITKVDGPVSGKVGQEIDLVVTLQGYNGCAVFGDLQDTNYGNTRIIKGKVIYQGEACYQALVPVVETYTFKASATGIYKLKFAAIDSNFITHTITVSK